MSPSLPPGSRRRHLAVPFALAAVAALAVSLSFAACSSANDGTLLLPTAPSRTVPLGTDVTLAPGESVVANPGALQLTFVGVVAESRCPTNALIQCVWGGSARVALRASSAAGQRDLTIETAPQRDTLTVDRYFVQLVAVTPAPLTLDPIPPASYRATLRVRTK